MLIAYNARVCVCVCAYTHSLSLYRHTHIHAKQSDMGLIFSLFLCGMVCQFLFVPCVVLSGKRCIVTALQQPREQHWLSRDTRTRVSLRSCANRFQIGWDVWIFFICALTHTHTHMHMQPPLSHTLQTWWQPLLKHNTVTREWYTHIHTLQKIKKTIQDMQPTHAHTHTCPHTHTLALNTLQLWPQVLCCLDNTSTNTTGLQGHQQEGKKTTNGLLVHLYDCEGIILSLFAKAVSNSSSNSHHVDCGNEDVGGDAWATCCTVPPPMGNWGGEHDVMIGCMARYRSPWSLMTWP